MATIRPTDTQAILRFRVCSTAVQRCCLWVALGLLVAVVASACGGSGGQTASGGSGPSGNPEDIRNAGNALAEKSDWAGAVVEYSKAIELDPKSDLAYEARATAYTQLQEYDKAIADASKAVELKPDRGGPRFARAVAYRLRGDLDLAIADLSRVIGDRNKTKWRGALYERALANIAKGNAAEARADLERIVQLEQQFPGEADKSWATKAQQELARLGQ